MPSKRRWLRKDVVLAIHDAQIAEHGGTRGIRDLGLLESGLARPKNAAAYGKQKVSIPHLAALYALGIIRNHPFVDGNKRVGLVLMELFLELNGFTLGASEKECYDQILAAAGGAVKEKTFIDWVRSQAVKQA